MSERRGDCDGRRRTCVAYPRNGSRSGAHWLVWRASMAAPRKILGMVGGMGSVASAYMLNRLVALTPATRDQDYIETIVHSNSRVPDRTAGILGAGTSPLAELERSVDLLTSLGVHYIVLACMTSHHFLPQLRQRTPAEFIDGVTETALRCAERHPEVRRVGLLASSGAQQAGVFQRAFAARGIETLIYSPTEQEKLFMEPVYAPWGIKAGHVYTIRAGCVKMEHALDDGSRRIVRMHYRGDAIGLESVLGLPHRNSAIVLQRADICRIPVSVIHALKQRNPHIYEQLMQRWQSNLEEAESFITELGTGQAETRLARLLLKLDDHSEHQCIPNLLREDIAAIIGVTTETASRLMADFRRRKFILENEDRGMHCDRDALKSLI